MKKFIFLFFIFLSIASALTIAPPNFCESIKITSGILLLLLGGSMSVLCFLIHKNSKSKMKKTKIAILFLCIIFGIILIGYVYPKIIVSNLLSEPLLIDYYCHGY